MIKTQETDSPAKVTDYERAGVGSLLSFDSSGKESVENFG